MDHNAIRVFVTVAQEGSLTRAGERIHMSQPAVSLQLKKLQDEIGLVLFERTARGMRLTEQGRRLLPAAQDALRALGGFRSAASDLQGITHGEIRLGTIVDPEFLRLGSVLRGIANRHPGLSFDLRHGMSGAMAREVEVGNLDVAYTLGAPGFPEYEGRFSVLPLVNFDYRVVAPSGWEERVHGQDWAALARLPWIATPPDSVHSRLLRQVLAPTGVEQNVVARVDLEPSMLELVRSGVALALARDSLALRAQHVDGLAIADRVSVPAALGFICRPERRLDPAIHAVTEVVAEVWGRNGG